MLDSKEFGVTVPAPTLTLDDSFNSNAAIGHLAYRLPSLPELLGLKQVDFDKYWTMTFTLSVQYTEDNGETNI